MEVEKLYGLVGYPLSHSFSKRFFSDKFKRENIKGVDYQNFEIKDISGIVDLVAQHKNLIGFNVTIPHKENIIPYLDELDRDAAEIGAVNTVCIQNIGDKSRLKGYNTDFHGFKESLLEFLSGTERKGLVFGSGGASKAIVQALKSLKIDYFIVSRHKSESIEKVMAYRDITEELVNEADILVNTTPVGMWPNIEQTLEIPYRAIKKGALVYDLIYNPDVTLFMQRAKENGAIVVNGLKMLELQANKAWELFNL